MNEIELNEIELIETKSKEKPKKPKKSKKVIARKQIKKFVNYFSIGVEAQIGFGYFLIFTI